MQYVDYPGHPVQLPHGEKFHTARLFKLLDQLSETRLYFYDSGKQG